MSQTQQSTTLPARVVIDGVPRVHFYEGGARCPEDIILPSVLRAFTEFMGDPDLGCKHCLARTPNCKINCSYSYLVGVTGAAFYLSWKEGWHDDNVALFYMSDDADAPYRRGMQAIGYAYEKVDRESGADEAEFRRRIVESIGERHMPVLAHGVIGPPELSIITGYDEGGDVLIGWNFFQNMPDMNANVEFEPGGYFRKRDWYKDTLGLMVVGERREKPKFGDSFRDALTFGLQVIRTPMVKPGPNAPEWYRDRHNGLAAYTAWAEHLLRDEDFPADDEAVLRQRHMVHESAVGTVAEARWYGSQFLLQAADPDHLHYNMAEELMHAAACFAGEHELMWKVWDLAGGNGNPDAWRKLAEPAVRRQMAPIILQSRDKCAQAAEHIERALAR
jgi:hypothetical protein